MTEIYIVRHGQTNSNIRNTYLGHTDVTLNETGKQQACEMAKRLTSIRFNAIYTSPLNRAVETAQIIAKKHEGTQIIMSYDFQERDYGAFDDLSMEEIASKYPDEHREWMENWYNYDYRVPDGESSNEVYMRAAHTLERIKSNYPDGRVLIVTHLGVGRHILAYLLGMNVKESGHFHIDNCSVSTIKVENGYGILTSLNK